MRLNSLATLGVKHVRNALAEAVYLRTGRDFTSPVSVYGEVIERCNYKCRYCDYWRRPNYRKEMSIEEWQRGLASLKEFIGSYHIEFSGGEPYIKKGFLDLISFCKENGIHWGVTTNGGAYLNEKVVERTVEAGPFNINISIDSHKAAVHNYSRGVDELPERYRDRHRQIAEGAGQGEGLDFPIIIKPVVHRLNFRQLPEMVRLGPGDRRDGDQLPAGRAGHEGGRGRAVDRRGGDGRAEARSAIELLAMKRAGAPILNSEADPRGLAATISAARRRRRRRCPAASACATIFIRSDGARRGLLVLPADRQRADPDRPRRSGTASKARSGRKETVACDQAVPVHMPLPEDASATS